MSLRKEEETCIWFHGAFPVFTHPVNDLKSFRLFTSQLVVTGTCRQRELAEAFGISLISIKRYAKKYRESGAAAFFKSPQVRKGSVLTEKVKTQAQAMLHEGRERREVAETLNIKVDTLRKAIEDGRLQEVKKKTVTPVGSNKSERNIADADVAKEMGMACTRAEERVLASVGVLHEAQSKFEPCKDVKYGGALCSLPALAANGLFRHLSGCLSLPKGYYGLVHIILVLAFMALCRIKSMEQLRYECPGELGKLLGLDRIPEVRTLRGKLNHLCEHTEVEEWGERLSRDWMQEDPLAAGVLYVDGHVRVYHGSQTPLPKRYVSRERLCLRGVSDYWVNDVYGRPYFVVSAPADPGMLRMLKEDIVPRLLKDVPEQPSLAELEANRWLPRFTLVFDREGYSPGFMKQMWNDHRIACLSYRKYNQVDWPEAEFRKVQVRMPRGEVLEMELAERGSWLGSAKDALWVREVRKRRSTGKQSSLIGTHYQGESPELAGSMFSRWSQENFFKYMQQNYSIDSLCGYKLESLPETTKVVNPAWRQIDGKIRSLQGQRSRKLAKFAELELKEPLDPALIKTYTKAKAALKEEVDELHEELEDLKKRRGEFAKHIEIAQMEEGDRFAQLAPKRKQFLDTIKMLAYRSETAMGVLLRKYLKREDDTRPLLRELYETEANLLPDEDSSTLTVELHHMTTPQSDRAIEKLLEALNEAEMTYPGTDLRLVYKMVSSIIPRGQEV